MGARTNSPSYRARTSLHARTSAKGGLRRTRTSQPFQWLKKRTKSGSQQLWREWAAESQDGREEARSRSAGSGARAPRGYWAFEASARAARDCWLMGQWRRGWDSNPRYACTHNGFRDRPDRPLWHLSGAPLIGADFAGATRRSEGRYSPLQPGIQGVSGVDLGASCVYSALLRRVIQARRALSCFPAFWALDPANSSRDGRVRSDPEGFSQVSHHDRRYPHGWKAIHGRRRRHAHRSSASRARPAPRSSSPTC